MILKQLFVSSAAAFAIAAAGSALAEQPATPFVSGDQPMNVEDAAQVKTDPSAKAQAKTEKMLKDEAAELSGNPPMDVEDAAQVKTDPSAKAQAKTEKMLKDEAAGLSGNPPMDVEDSKQIKAPK